MKFKWKCPKCGATAHKCGKMGLAASNRHAVEDCDGFICDCDGENERGHGETLADPCPNARCYHCDWGGTFPTAPKELQAWEKKALEAGWTAPGQKPKKEKLRCDFDCVHCRGLRQFSKGF